MCQQQLAIQPRQPKLQERKVTFRNAAQIKKDQQVQKQKKKKLPQERFFQATFSLLSGRQGRSCSCNELCTSPTVVIKGPILNVHKIRHNKHVLQQSIVDEEHDSRVVTCTQHPHAEIKGIDQDEEESNTEEHHQWKRQSHCPVHSSDWVSDWKRPHAVSLLTKGFIICRAKGIN